ncbi:hypothetical protein [Sagittula sp. MA-2]|jgi:hypothetical protein|uniref:hypothetical protein n=1 Tax=Sagittula sp. MA-2 TaxID=3048007 RepID=UPI0024C26CF7|nr:hypothetical protein [Sagittula sp. MA-2]WHZ34232.1 hypothetical protein QNI11_16525 [Sagittula sp. MA-2]
MRAAPAPFRPILARAAAGVLLLLSAAPAPAPAAAQSPIADIICAPTPQMEKRLASHRNITKAASGLRNPEEVLEVWTGAEGTWTMVIRYASGTSCIVAMGDAWQMAQGEAPS